jgi:hypothetical protein
MKVKSLVKELRDSGREPQGRVYVWEAFAPETLKDFTKYIKVPDIAQDVDGNCSAEIGAIVSGMPTVFSRCNLFRNAFDNIKGGGDVEKEGLMLFYQSLISEWKGLLSCIALNSSDIKVKRIYLGYTDGKSRLDTGNVYEPMGAFGNMLFERSPLWSILDGVSNPSNIPFIDVIIFNDGVVGGTSPDSLLFTSVSYRIDNDKNRYPFVDVKSGKFIDPLRSDLNKDQLFQIFGYTKYLLNKIENFRKRFNQVDPPSLRPDYQAIRVILESWIEEMEALQKKRGYSSKEQQMTLEEVECQFGAPFDILFNYSTRLWGNEGNISDEKTGDLSICFKPEELLLPESTEILQIDFGVDASSTKDYLKSRTLLLLEAVTKSNPSEFNYFALPLSGLGLRVFGKNLEALLGLRGGSEVKSRISAIYDPASEKLEVELRLQTASGKSVVKKIVYNVIVNPLKSKDILIWPNFISKQWTRYFMYSEIPHNDAKFQATPFIGDVDDDFFRILLDANNTPLYLARDGAVVKVDESSHVKFDLHVSLNNAVIDNDYKYEIYESNQPFKGVLFSYNKKECGFGVIRYDSVGDNRLGIPFNKLQDRNDNLISAHLGVDFGSTNTSIAYYSEGDNACKGMELYNRRVSLLGDDNKNNNERPAVEDEIYFFQNDQIKTNSIKSVLTIHDSRRVVNRDKIESILLSEKLVKGGFPCFEKNLPIEKATDSRYMLSYQKSGRAELVHNMKWSSQPMDKSYKTAYLSSLLLHVYAQLFIDKHVPKTLKWSYPSSMGENLLLEYRNIWNSLNTVSPIKNSSGKNNEGIKICEPMIVLEEDSVFSSFSGVQNSPEDGGWGGGGGDAVGGWLNNQSHSVSVKDISLEDESIDFNLTEIKPDNSLTEACSVACFLVGQAGKAGGFSVQANEIVICFDVGGSTTDVTVLCRAEKGIAMIKQSSIRFAAQRVAHATKSSPNFEKVLKRICDEKKIKIHGLNCGASKYSAETASYFFEQLVDRLDGDDFSLFYRLISGECKELMCVNLYVTGLIMFYAGQLTEQICDIVRSNSETKKFYYQNGQKPKVKIAFAGKGARIFDWAKEAVSQQVSDKYYIEMFLRGLGGVEKAKAFLYGPPTINPQGMSEDIKYEVSKGLAKPMQKGQLWVLGGKNKVIEILGEDNFFVINGCGEYKKLDYNRSVTAEMFESIGSRFICSPVDMDLPCPRFMDFAKYFHSTATQICGLKMTRDDFMAGFSGMNIVAYVQKQPEYIEAMKKKEENKGVFDYVVPIIILEGMKFLEDCLLPGLKNQ